ncbi:hypothetical protein VNO77_18531 [Canavalia gladiata]|uniref:Uncharacterized protein n=1 Tax=Canavalia gladiata TaxID=3824 RepID=A0AAN9QJR4_CANGL
MLTKFLWKYDMTVIEPFKWTLLLRVDLDMTRSKAKSCTKYPEKVKLEPKYKMKGFGYSKKVLLANAWGLAHCGGVRSVRR